jgi:hypothetical protein
MKIFNWQEFNEGKKNNFSKKIKYFHVSGTKYRVGQIIGGPGKTVCLNTSPVTHGTIWDVVKGGFSSYEDYLKSYLKNSDEYWKIRDEWNKNPIGDKPEYPKTMNDKPQNIWVYEVKPFSTPTFVGVNDEYRAIDNFVEVVKIVGNAKGILQNHIKKFGNTKRAWSFGAKALGPSFSKRTTHFNDYEGDKGKKPKKK